MFGRKKQLEEQELRFKREDRDLTNKRKLDDIMQRDSDLDQILLFFDIESIWDYGLIFRYFKEKSYRVAQVLRSDSNTYTEGVYILFEKIQK